MNRRERVYSHSEGSEKRFMLSRRVTEHVRHKNCFAVAIDVAIVVVGVFIGIQASNWNNAQSEVSKT